MYVSKNASIAISPGEIGVLMVDILRLIQITIYAYII